MEAGNLTNTHRASCRVLPASPALLGLSMRIRKLANSIESAILFALVAALSQHNAPAGSVVAWGSLSGTNMPAGLASETNYAAISEVIYTCLALRADGTVVAWGDLSSVSPQMTNIVAIAAGFGYQVALKANGTLVFNGAASSASATNPPAGLSNVVAIGAGRAHTIALRSDGTLVNFGTYWNSAGPELTMPVPASLTNIVAVSAGYDHDLLLRSDGSLLVWGWNGNGQTNVPPGLTNVTLIAAGGDDNLVLTEGGALVSWGRNNWGQTNVPDGLTNIVSIASGSSHNFVLHVDGTITAWGWNDYGQCNIPASLPAAQAVTGGAYSSLALVGSLPPLAFALPMGPVFKDGSFSVSVPTVRGRHYRLEYKDSLDEVRWTMLPPLPGDGTVRLLTDYGASSQGRYYRLRQLQP